MNCLIVFLLVLNICLMWHDGQCSRNVRRVELGEKGERAIQTRPDEVEDNFESRPDNREDEKGRRTDKVYETIYFDCRKVVPQNPLSLIVNIQAEVTFVFYPTCENYDTWPCHGKIDKWQITVFDGYTTQTRETTFEALNITTIELDGGKSIGYNKFGKLVGGDCDGDYFSYYGVYPIDEITKCKLLERDCKSKCCPKRLFEFGSTQSSINVIGPKCYSNSCDGFRRYLFPDGIE